MKRRAPRGCLAVVLAAGVVAAACAAYLHSRDFFAADACLDRGGSYHYDRGECSLTENYRGEVPPLFPF